MLEAMRETSRDIDQPMAIVLDGLDECNMRQQKDFMKVFTCLKEKFWKFLVTSRFDQDIFSKVCRGCYQYSIAEDDLDDNIRNFVDSALG